MSDRKLVLRTADQSRRADIDFDQGSTGSEIIQAAVDNWALPADRRCNRGSPAIGSRRPA